MAERTAGRGLDQWPVSLTCKPLYTDRPMDSRNGIGGAFGLIPGKAQEKPARIGQAPPKSLAEVNPWLAKSVICAPAAIAH